ncbi:hypothetical protein [Prauserella cavernicola]|uniref:Uncharacterized protein n=1 Tax=Prauserella cavernicola TaxID=2800127 RepID=A0A934QPQ9_9PSEU|nr:hypothetical protein [Prauserella cavernicola]MBK1784355.1 hypothetical protein [Prauserella cavernicola]
MASVNPLRKLRASAGTRLARLIDYRVEERLRPFVERLEQLHRLDRHADRLTEQENCTNDHRRRLAELEAGLEDARGHLRWTRGEVERLVPHVAAQEGRLEDLRAKLALAPSADKPELAEARTLIEEVQRQHAQVRVRLTGIAQYEERLRRLEDRAGAAG